MLEKVRRGQEVVAVVNKGCMERRCDLEMGKGQWSVGGMVR